MLWLHPKEQAILIAISMEWLAKAPNEVITDKEQKSGYANVAQLQRTMNDTAIKAWKYLITAELEVLAYICIYNR